MFSRHITKPSYALIYATMPLESMLYLHRGATNVLAGAYIALLLAAVVAHECCADYRLSLGRQLPPMPVTWLPLILIIVNLSIGYSFLALGWIHPLDPAG